jgi:hypothetical protein
MARAVRKSSRTGTVEIKHCGFNDRPKLMVAGPADDDEASTDVLPELFRAFEGRKVKVTVEAVKS